MSILNLAPGESAIRPDRSRIALSYFCHRRRKALAPQGPRKLPKLDVAGSTPVARSLRKPLSRQEVSSPDARSFKSTPNLRHWTSETVAGSASPSSERRGRGSVLPASKWDMCESFRRGDDE